MFEDVLEREPKGPGPDSFFPSWGLEDALELIVIEDFPPRHSESIVVNSIEGLPKWEP
jgi:hypothetical protein